MYTLKLVLDIQKDMRNRWKACNKTSHWVNRKEKIDQDIVEKISWKTEEQAYEFLLSYLQKYYKDNVNSINNTINFGQQIIDNDIDMACQTLEEITGKPIYRKDFIWYITTFPRWPYDYEKWYIRLYYNRSIKYYIGIFLHELLHFQFIHHYKNREPVVSLTNEQFEFLKESMTIILNHECKQFLWKPDTWYSIHRGLREILEKFWTTNKNFDDFVVYWCNQVKKIIT